MQKRALAVFALAAVIVTGCSGGATSGGSGSKSGGGETGVTDTEIHLGATTPLTGPAASYSASTRASEAYFDSVNAQGGVNGRKIVYTYLDDQYDPSKTVPLTKQLVDQEKVFALFSSVGSVTQQAVYQRLNSQKVPDVLIGSGANSFVDPVLPYVSMLLPSFDSESSSLAGVIKDKFAGKKVGLLHQNDDAGAAAVTIYKKALGDTIVSDQSYEVTDPSVAAQITNLRNAGAEVVLCSISPKFLALALREAAAQDWHPQFLSNGTGLDGTVLATAGTAADGLLTARQFKDATDEADPAVKKANDIVRQYGKNIKPDAASIRGIAAAQIMVAALQGAGKDLTRDSLLKSIDNLKLDNGPWYATVAMSPTDHDAVECEQLVKVSGGKLNSVGDVLCPSGK